MNYNPHDINWSEQSVQSKQFWENQLAQEQGERIFFDLHPHSEQYASKTMELNISAELTHEINRISGDKELFAYIIFLTILQIQMYRYTGKAVSVNVPVFQDGISEERSTINRILPLNIHLNDQLSVKQTIGLCRQEVMAVLKHQYYPLNELNPSSYQFVIGMANLHTDLESASCTNEQIQIWIEKQHEGFCFRITYNHNYYKEEGIQAFWSRYLYVLENSIANTDQQIDHVALLSSQETANIMQWSAGEKSIYPKYSTIAELFENIVQSVRTETAIFAGKEICHYEALNRQANILAHFLRSCGVGNGDIIPVICDKNTDTIASMLAVIKSGAAYLPIDKDYPEARIQYLIENSQAKRIIDAAGVSDRFGDWKHTLDMLCPNDQKLDVTQIQNPEIINSPEDTAYLIYTSGTTGKPKGVCITHRSLAKMVLNNGYMKIQAGDQMLQAGSLSFDASVQQIWLALLHGIPLHMVAKNVLLDSEQLGVYINRQQITHLILPTSLFNQMDSSAFQCVKYLIAGGEVISSKQVHRCLEAYPELHIINGYGPTENTVISTAFPMTNRWDEKEAIPIGKPVSNSSAYIMDKNMQLLPAGVPGELVVGGDGVARGYWNHEQLTADKFKNNQYIPGERLYRTGDLARWRADGNLEFLGRIDEQVKIRGYRVELGEIEQTLTAYRQVKEAVVIAQKGQSAVTQLYAYIIGFTEDSIDLNAVNAYLRNELPEYMIPSALMQLENIPLTPNGKTDRKALPEPDLSAKTSVYCAPKNELEQMLVTVWEEVLGIEPVGIYDSFLDIGGDSIRSIQIASRLRSRQIHVGVQEIMQYKTIAEIALHVKEAHISLPQNEVEGIVEKTPIIRYFLEFTQPSAFRHFNQSVMLYHPNHFEDRIVKSVMESLIKHHDGLRMILVNSGDEQSLPVFDTEVQLEIRAFNDSALFYNFQSFDWVTQIDAEQQITQKAEKMQLAMNISKGPLIQVGVFHTAAGDHLLISMHHLIVDSVSWQIFLEDFYAAYKAATKKEQYIFPEKTTSFQNWAASQKEYARNHQLLKELDYWQKVVEKQTTIKPIKNHTLLKNMISQTITLNDEATEKLLKKANRAYGTTINDLLLAALGYAVQQFNGQEHVSLMLEGHGREPLKGETGKGIDITRTIGWFTSIYPVNLQITDSDLGMLVKRTKEVLHRVPNKGIGYGILKHLAELDLTNNNLLSTGTDISFNYLGQLDNSYRNDQEMIMSPLGTGVQASPDLHVRENLQINGFVKDQKLQMIMEFNEEQWTEADRNQLASLYEYALYRVIDHCTAIQYTEKTPVDYGIHDLSLEEVMEFKKYIIEQVSTEATIEHINRLTPMQQGMFFTLSEQKDTQAYIVQGEYSLKGRVQPFIFQKALDILCQQHQVLNSIFVEHEKHPVQIVLSNWKKEVSVIDIQDMAYPEEACIAYKQSLLQQGFDIQKDPLFHLSLVQTQPEEFRLIITCHHLILDGWSHGRMLKDLLDIYRRVEKGSINTVIPEYDFASYIEWLEDQEEDQALIYWQNQLEDYSQDIILPIDKNTTTEYAEGIHEVILLADQSDYLKRAAQNNAITLNTLCQTAWGILLQRYSNTNDVIFGAVVSGRPPEMDNIEQMMGMFINTLPIRITSRSEQTVIELLQEVQINNQNKSPYEYVSLAKIQNTTSLKYHRLNTLMVLENYPDISYENQDELNFTIERIHGREQTAYDLNIIFTSKNDWKFTLMYNRNLFTEEIIRQLGDHLQYILQLLVEYPNRQTEQITLMDTETCLELIHKFNPVHTTPSIERTLAEVLEEEAGRRSYQPAVISGGKQLTYGELNRRANQLAHCLRQQGVQPDEPVPVLCSKSIDTIVAMVGIIKAGGAYVPIDESYPAARISYLLTDSQARWIVGS
ncbi:non-ribosomal peptide synthetase, partial [Paenibacillus dauci]|uniref:non-ribosomal peptide synthetase n=1 Tax=Paenibacillus dauci TaxID=1567106 RepID=UPI0006195C24